MYRKSKKDLKQHRIPTLCTKEAILKPDRQLPIIMQIRNSKIKNLLKKIPMFQIRNLRLKHLLMDFQSKMPLRDQYRNNSR